MEISKVCRGGRTKSWLIGVALTGWLGLPQMECKSLKVLLAADHR